MKIGKGLKALRTEKKLTLEDLSRKSGVAVATLSRMEHDKMTGTLESHMKICQVMGVSLSDFYRDIEETKKTVEVVKEKERVESFARSKNVTYEMLATIAKERKITPVLIRIRVSGQTQKEQDKPGTEKFLYVLDGKIETEIGHQKQVLKKGDGLYFDASLPHLLKNAGKSEANALCVSSLPAV